MQALKLLVVLAARGVLPSLALKTTIKVEDLCDDCKIVNRQFDFPEYAEGFQPRFNFSITGNLTEALDFSHRYHVTAKLGPVMAWNGTGVFCGITVFGDSVAFRAEVSLPACDTKPGFVAVHGNVRVSFPAPPIVPIIFLFEAFNSKGEAVIRLKIHLTHPLSSWAESQSGPLINGSPLNNRPPALRATAELPLTPTARRTTITAQDCCDETCLLRNVALNFPPHYSGFGFNFNVAGTVGQDINILQFGWTAVLHVLGVVPLTVLLGNGTACGKTTTGDVVEFGMETDFVTCPIGAGPYSLNGHARFTLPLDAIGNIAIHIDTNDDTGARVSCTEVTLRFWGNNTDDTTILPDALVTNIAI